MKKQILEFAGQSFVRPTFSKKDGTITTRLALFGVKKYLKDPSAYFEINYDTPTVIYYDVRKKAYRSFRIENFISLFAGGQFLTNQKQTT